MSSFIIYRKTLVHNENLHCMRFVTSYFSIFQQRITLFYLFSRIRIIHRCFSAFHWIPFRIVANMKFPFLLSKNTPLEKYFVNYNMEIDCVGNCLNVMYCFQDRHDQFYQNLTNIAFSLSSLSPF